MTPNWTYAASMIPMAFAVAIGLFPVMASTQSVNPWAPYPPQQTQPAPQPVAPMAKPKYYQEPRAVNPAAQPSTQAPAPSRFAPADLAQRLSAPPRQAPVQGFAPFGNPAEQFGQPQGYSPQGYATRYPQGPQMNPMPSAGGYGGYGGYGPPIIGNNGWGPSNNNYGNNFGNNFFPFGF